MASGALPATLWGRERRFKQRMALEYNIRIAQSLGHAPTLLDYKTGGHNLRVTFMASLFGKG